MEKTGKTRSLVVTIAVMFLMLNMAILVVAGSLNIYISIQNQQELIYNRMQLVVRSAADVVSEFFEDKLSTLRKAVALSDFTSLDAGGRRRALRSMLDTEPSFRQIVLLDGRRQETMRVSRMPSRAPGQLTPEHITALLARITEGAGFASPVYTDEQAGEPVMLLAYPLDNGPGAPAGMLIAEVRLKFMWDLWELIDSTLIGDNALSYVADKEGHLIAYKDASRVLKKENVPYLQSIHDFIHNGSKKDSIPVTKGIRGDHVTVVYAPLRLVDWAVIVELPVVDAYRPLISYTLLSVATVLVSLILTFLLGMRLSRRITRPLINLRDATKKISRGDRSATIRIESQDEIGELAGSFNQMVEDLRNTTVSVEELQKEQKRFKDIAFSTAGFIWEVDANGVYTYCSEKVVDILGYTREEIVGKTPFDMMPPDKAEKIRKGFETLISSKTIIKDLENWNIRKDGRMVCLLTNGVPLLDDAGNLVGYRGVDKDITERKAMEELLQEEKERLSVTLRSIGDGVIATDVGGRVALINKVAETLTGWAQEEALGRPVEDVFRLVHEENREPCEVPVKQILETGEIAGPARRAVLVAKDGTERTIADSGAPIRDRESRVIGSVLVFRDVTEESKLEQERIRAQKLESIGLLAGGIAHDFNNILVGVHSNISILRSHLQSGDQETLDILRDMGTAARQAWSLTNQLLTFTKGGLPVKKAVNIAELIRDAVHFSLRGSNLKAEFDVPDSLWPLEVDQGQITQVINNMVMNADQAMPQGGAIRIHARNVTAKPGDKLPPETRRYVMLSIQDTGAGISKENLGRIFDPYFTTKPKGNGLGLATSYSIVRNHGGHIAVESKPGKGTTFFVYLPVKEGVSLEPEKKETKLVAGRGRILVMDDEELVRNVFKRMLTMLGYEVELSVDGSEAIGKYRAAKESGRPFDAVIMDLTVPGGMGGKDAVKALREIDPGVKAVATSGYSTDPVMSSFRDYGFTGVLNKPFSIEDVSELLSSILPVQ